MGKWFMMIGRESLTAYLSPFQVHSTSLIAHYSKLARVRKPHVPMVF
jgi:hypothetical protein